MNALKTWFADGGLPETLISDNGKEFVNRELADFRKQMVIEHVKGAVENHKANGRIERLIGTLRNMIIKISDVNTAIKIDLAISAYNDTFHSAIKCTHRQAILKPNNVILAVNNIVNPRQKHKLNSRPRKKTKYRYNQNVKISQYDNICKLHKGKY